MNIKRLILPLFGLLCLLFTGCVMKSVSELYALPEQSADFQALQSAINSTLPGSGQYSSPINGTNQQPIQMVDVDGDQADEAIVFAVTGGENPLKAYVFDKVGKEYVNICVIEGSGSTFDRVEYAQLDGSGGNEIVIGRQISNQTLQAVGVYSIVNHQLVEQMTANYSEFTLADLDEDGNRDLFLLRFHPETRTGVAELYRCIDGRLEREPECGVSMLQSGVRQINVGRLSPTYRGIFVSGVLEDGSAVTDVYIFRENSLVQISSSQYLELASTPIRGYSVFATDIDSDGAIEFPHVIELPETETGDTAHHCISWYNFDPENGLTLKQNTYHSFGGGWYLRLPSRIGTNFTVSRGDEFAGTFGLRFSSGHEANQPQQELFTVYTLTGSARSSLTPEDNCFVLSSRGETVYVARLGSGAKDLNLTQEEVSAMFNYIQVNWNSGET